VVFTHSWHAVGQAGEAGVAQFAVAMAIGLDLDLVSKGKGRRCSTGLRSSVSLSLSRARALEAVSNSGGAPSRSRWYAAGALARLARRRAARFMAACGHEHGLHGARPWDSCS
jgi:hypothetical protein